MGELNGGILAPLFFERTSRYIALFKGVKYSGVRNTPLYFTLPYFTQLKNPIVKDRGRGAGKEG
jgi:hypothetical protein